MRRWAMAVSVNKKLNNPVKEHHCPQYYPCHMLPNSAIMQCDDKKSTEDKGYVTPVEAAGTDKVYVSRIRKDETIENGLNLWIVSDNLRKGAALNAVQIAELIVKKYSNCLH